jgi:hypothetical protein
MGLEKLLHPFYFRTHVSNWNPAQALAVQLCYQSSGVSSIAVDLHIVPQYFMRFLFSCVCKF